jgi:glycosyltransferase involved in cell wall biosynthesis
MRLLYVSDSGTVSGAEIVLLHYLDAYRAPEFETCVFFRRGNDRLQHELERRGVPFVASDAFSRSPIRTTARIGELAHFGRALRTVSRQLAAEISARRIDLVHTVMYPASLYVALAGRLTGCPQIWHEHGIKHVHAVNKPIYRMVSRSCGAVIGPSNAVLEPLRNAGISRRLTRTVYNGIDLTRFDRAAVDVAATRASLRLSPEERPIGLFGQMLPHKGHATLIEAAPSVLQRFPTAVFFLVGALENPPYQQQLTARIASHGLESRFRFTGWRGDAASVMASMDAVVVPTLTPEPAALTLMESMALERPVVATRNGGTPELILDGETGLLFSPGAADQLADRLVDILTDPGRAAGLGRAGRRRMLERFSLPRHLNEVRSLYQECAVPPPSCRPH